MANRAVYEGEIRVVRLELGPWPTNSYLVSLPSGEALLVDAPAEAERILAALQGLKVGMVVITHSHADHIGALERVRGALSVPVACHPLDAPRLPIPPDRLLEDGDRISLGTFPVEVLHTPGHTPGSLCLLLGRHLFSGDTLFPNGPGKTASPADFQRILRSLEEKLFPLPDDTLVYPGHGEGTVLGREKALFARFRERPHDPKLCGDVVWVP